MNTEQHHKPQDMNEAVRGIAQEAAQAAIGNAVVSSLINAGNALRNQAFAMLGNIPASDILTPPALMEDGSSLVLLPYYRGIQGFFRLLATYSPSGERVIVAFIENEAELVKTGFFNIGDAQRAELNRQLDAIGFKNEGVASVELGLMIVEKPVEGYEYFKAEPVAEVTDAPAPAPAPVALDSVVADVAPQA